MDFEVSNKQKGRYINPYAKDLKRSLVDFLLWRSGYYDDNLPIEKIPLDFQYPFPVLDFEMSQPKAVWLGHSTFLIEKNDISFLTDPLFSDYCSPIPFKALKRQHECPLNIPSLPLINYVLISHNHYDHLDEKSILSLVKFFYDICFIVPKGLKKWFTRRAISNVIELDWGEVYSENDLKVTSVPAQHFSGRALWDKNRTLWCGYVVEIGNKSFYFVGDTGYNSIQFKRIGEVWPKIDLSMIPIGTYLPKRFMQPVHISPEEAVEIHCDVGSRFSLGMHWKTFRLSEESLDRPPFDLYQAMDAKGLKHSSFLPIEPGEWVNW